nr:MAG TPA: hypothetical protein [Bacteriophage sp.]
MLETLKKVNISHKKAFFRPLFYPKERKRIVSSLI